MNPLVSIIVPVYNVSAYVEDCLSSVVTQTYDNIEILCIDDRGTDGSMDVIRNYAKDDSRIKIIQNEKNLGLGATRNVGICHASGSYLFFLDSDDFISTDAIEKLVMAAEASEADVIYGGGHAFASEQNGVDKHYLQELNEKFLKAPIILTEISLEQYYCALKTIPGVAWGKLFKASFIRSNSLFFVEEKVLHEDDGFHAKCMSCQPKIQCLPERLYHYRIRPKSIMSEAREKKSMRWKNLKLSIDDAINFITKSEKDKQYVNYVKEVYCDFYAYKNVFMTYYVGKYEMRLKLFGLNIIKKTSKDGQTTTFALLGMKLFKHSIAEAFLNNQNEKSN